MNTTIKLGKDLAIGDVMYVPSRDAFYPIVKTRPVNSFGCRMVDVDAGLVSSEGEVMYAPIVLEATQEVTVSA